jgi:type III secretory pathway lipoprotein EscJ
MQLRFFKHRGFIKKLLFGGLLAVLLLSGCSLRKKVQTVKIEAEANQIIDVLRENGVRAKKEEIGEGERKTFEIWVDGDDDDLGAAIQIMEDHCLGQPEPPAVESSGIISSVEVEKAREYRRMKINIESQLREIPGTTCVNVNFVPPQDRALAINPYPATASVVVNFKTPTFQVNQEQVAGIIARSVPDLKPENVSVVQSYKPLRPLPENLGNRTFTRIALVSGVGLATILAFISIVFFLQKKRRAQGDEFEDDFDTDAAPKVKGETSLLEEGDEYDEDIKFP